MKNVLAILSCVLVLSLPSFAAAQGDQSSSSSSSSTSQGGKTTATARTDVQPGPRYLETLTNVQIEVNLTDQTGNQAPEKKTVSMIVSNREWGKIRSAASVMPPGETPYGVELNVDARPWLSVDGPIRLEMTVVYSPNRTGSDPTEKRPTGINQSQTVILQSGKPLVVAQAADPVSDRKVIVEVKATILK